jgi:hypothetical protein
MRYIRTELREKARKDFPTPLQEKPAAKQLRLAVPETQKLLKINKNSFLWSMAPLLPQHKSVQDISRTLVPVCSIDSQICESEELSYVSPVFRRAAAWAARNGATAVIFCRIASQAQSYAGKNCLTRQIIF